MTAVAQNSISSQLLHTDILEKLYSEITVSVESQTDTVRKVHLLDGQGVSRTYAVTRFHPSGWTDEIARIISELRQGKSLGETFRSYGYEISKKLNCTNRIGLSEKLIKLMGASGSMGTLHQYEASVVKNGYEHEPIMLATITEVYAPELSETLEKEQLLAFTPQTAPKYTSDFRGSIIL